MQYDVTSCVICKSIKVELCQVVFAMLSTKNTEVRIIITQLPTNLYRFIIDLGVCLVIALFYP